MSQLPLLDQLLVQARRVGADAADALIVQNTSLAVTRRIGKIEQLERSEAHDVGLRVFVGRRQAIVSSTDADARGFAALAERAVAMARVVPEDAHAGLPEHAVRLPLPELDLADPEEPTAERLLDRAAAVEEAALAVPGVTNSEGGEASWSRSTIALAASSGFMGEYVRTLHSTGVSVLAGSGTGMERDWDHSTTVHLADQQEPSVLGRRAGEQAVARLKPRRPATARLPVILAPRVAGSLLGHLAAAINGAAVARGTSFLKNSLGQVIFPPGMRVQDQPLRRRGLRSRPFDGEGVASRDLDVVVEGRLVSWMLDTRSGRQLGLPSTGHASRGTGGSPTPGSTNLWLAPGAVTAEALMSDIEVGLYVTDLIGMGVNMVTGDYSRGAAGFMIRGGCRAEPVSGVTIAGRLQDMFRNLAAANDLEFRRGTDAPTLRVEGLTVAGA